MNKQNKKSKVALVKCDSYDQEKVNTAIARGLKLLGGIEQFIKPEDYVLLKPNFLSDHPPEEGVTTHPGVFRAMVKQTLEVSDNVKYGDSPGRSSVEKVAKVSGLQEVAEEFNIKLKSFEEGQEVFYKENGQTRKFKIAKEVLASDTLINLAKFKTHNLTRITGAVKNIFGCVSGLEKAEFHLKLPEVADFSKMLVELCLLVKPKLHIIDGIMGMEGNGPNAGNMRPVNVLLFSKDPVALDTVFAKIVNLDPEKVGTNYYGRELGLGNTDLDNIELIGDNIDDFIIEDYDVYRGSDASCHPLNPILRMQFLKNWLSRKPVIDKQDCIKCGACIEQCPTDPKSLSRKTKNDYPSYNYSSCIRCYCCQEICPEKAIFVKTPMIRKVIDHFYN
ncbi:MAG: DUF362 domain-containing protein [Candidatus Marinimicrobia bacterium]|nr:DUF362 domain-containing protein [Candidatus Neomarinimicrobiota bacterium]